MTRLKLKSTAYLIPFIIQNERVVRQLKMSEGFIQGKQLATPSLSMWTVTLWSSKEDIGKFYLSGSHKQAMKNISKWSSEAATGHQEIDLAELPSWQEIRKHLLKVGHFTTIEKASLDHSRGIILEPKFTLLTRFIFPA